MARSPRVSQGGLVYHVLNRANARVALFVTEGDYGAFEAALDQAIQRYRTRVIAYCAMPNHWHMLLWPNEDGELSRFVGWLTMTHTQRWHSYRRSAGTGHLYQGRFKSFPVQSDAHLLSVWRYVERNPIRAGLGARADAWRWSSLWRREHGTRQARELLSDGPVPRPANWLDWVNEAQTAAELDRVRASVERMCPYGGAAWVREVTQAPGR